eukprot:1160351-Pelagomonas_calceolata.AAC.1
MFGLAHRYLRTWCLALLPSEMQPNAYRNSLGQLCDLMDRQTFGLAYSCLRTWCLALLPSEMQPNAYENSLTAKSVRDAAKRVTKVAAECKMPDMVSQVLSVAGPTLRSYPAGVPAACSDLAEHWHCCPRYHIQCTAATLSRIQQSIGTAAHATACRAQLHTAKFCVQQSIGIAVHVTADNAHLHTAECCVQQSIGIAVHGSDSAVKAHEETPPGLRVPQKKNKRVCASYLRQGCAPIFSSDYEEYVASFRPDIMEPVTAWVRGARFAELSKMTEIFEAGVPSVCRSRCKSSCAGRCVICVVAGMTVCVVEGWTDSLCAGAADSLYGGRHDMCSMCLLHLPPPENPPFTGLYVTVPFEGYEQAGRQE